MWQTDKLFQLDILSEVRPMESSDKYIINGFLSLQLTLDKALINLSLF